MQCDCRPAATGSGNSLRIIKILSGRTDVMHCLAFPLASVKNSLLQRYYFALSVRKLQFSLPVNNVNMFSFQTK